MKRKSKTINCFPFKSLPIKNTALNQIYEIVTNNYLDMFLNLNKSLFAKRGRKMKRSEEHRPSLNLNTHTHIHTHTHTLKKGPSIKLAWSLTQKTRKIALNK